MTRAFLCLVAWMLCAQPLVARAEDKIPDEVRAPLLKALQEGRRAYETGDYARALQQFRQARTLHALPSLWFLEAQCLEKLNRPLEATAAYERFLLHAGEDRRRESAVRSIALLQQRYTDAGARLRVTTTPRGAQVQVKGVMEAPQLSPVVLQGRGGDVWEVTLSMSGYASQQRKVSLETGRTLELEVTLLPLPGPRPVPTGVWVLGGISATSLLGGGASLLVAGLAAGEVDAHDARRGEPGAQRPANYDALVARHNTSLVLGWSLLGLGVASAAGALWWWQTSRDGPQISLGPGKVGIRAQF